jgi:antitoxin component YwqK of YwqJK toxin-antitoxin module
MVQKELLRFKQLGLFALLITMFSCTNTKHEKEMTFSSSFIETASIPRDTVLLTDKDLKLDNGLYYFKTKPFSGQVKEVYENSEVKMIANYLQGMQHGTTYTFYANGMKSDIRNYSENKSYGKQIGYWQNGNQRFEFNYINDKREGLQKQWYESGAHYAFLTFKDDREEGMQQAWRENGKPYINYEVKDGLRYGLQKSALCYTLADEKLITKE